MTDDPSFGQDPMVVGKTKEAQNRNAQLLSGYDYSQYVEALTGYTGQDRQRIAMVHWTEAVRTCVGPRGNYKAGLARLSNGKLVIAVCRYNDDHKHYGIFVYESVDEGLTWQEIGKTPLVGKEMSLTALPDDTIVMTAQRYGLKVEEIPISRSEDGGQTWETQMIPGADYPRNLIVEPDGSLLMVRALKPDWLNKGDGSSNLQLARSKDGAKTWEFSEGLVNWDFTQFGELSTIRLEDGRLLTAIRRQIPGTKGEGFEDTLLTESSDDGKHWAKPRQMTNTAEVQVHLTKLHDGRILATYSNYHLPWGTYAIVSTDGGKSWDLEHPIQLSLSAGYLVGWAVTLQLPDGSLITSCTATTYYQQPPEQTSSGRNTCEVVRWRLQ